MFLFDVDLLLACPREEVVVLPVDFLLDEEGVLRGMRLIVAQMVCFSFAAHLKNW